MYATMTVEERAELIKEAFLHELGDILRSRQAMTKGAAGVGIIPEAAEALFKMLASGARGERAAMTGNEALRIIGEGRAAGRLTAENESAIRQMYNEYSSAGRARDLRGVESADTAAPAATDAAAFPKGPPGQAAPGVPPAAATRGATTGAPGVVDQPRGPVPTDSITPGAAGGPTPPTAAQGQQVADALGAGGGAVMPWYRKLQMGTMSGVGRGLLHGVLPVAAGVGTGLLTQSPTAGIAVGLGALGLGRLGSVGRGATMASRATEAGRAARQAELAAGGIPGKGGVPWTEAPYVAKARAELEQVMREHPEEMSAYWNAARPNYGRGAAIGIPAAAGLGYWGGKKVLEGATDTGEGSGKSLWTQIPATILGSAGGMELMKRLGPELGLPDWTKWLGLLGGPLAASAVGG